MVFMKSRIVSDIHCDVNKKCNDNYDFGNDFVICCGDISGDRFTTENWIKKNIKQGIIVAGNHLGYNFITGDKEDTLNYSIKYLQEQFHQAPIYFLENQVVEIENIIFVGCTLFTDFNLYINSLNSMMIAAYRLNDFRYVKILKDKKIKKITPQEQFEIHNKRKSFIESICRNNPNKKIVVITHHAPSIKSVPIEYGNDILSAAYASNLEDIIQKYNNLKLWCHGHMHQNCDYTLYGTRIICNPRGYYNENPNFIKEGVIVDLNNL